jgi:hypothetical protein
MGNASEKPEGAEGEALTGEKTMTTKEKMEEARSCTDWPCLIIFLSYLGLMGYIMMYAYDNADMNRLTNGIDFQGNVCGSGNTSDFPYLYWCGEQSDFVGFPTSLNLNMPICARECPGEDSEGTEFCPTPPEAVLTGHPEQYGAAPYSLVTTITQEVVEQPTYPTRYLANRYCVPNSLAHMANATVATGLMRQIQEGPMSSRAFQYAQAASSLHNNYRLLIFVGVFAVFLSYAYLLLLRIFAKPLVYGCLAILSAGAILCSIAILVTTFVEDQQRYNPLFLHMPAQEAQIWSSVVAAIGLIIGVVVAVIIFCFHEVIATAVGCIEAACECMFSMPTMLLEPLVGSILKVTTVMLLMGGLIALLSTGEITHSSLSVSGQSIHGVAREVSFNETQQYYLLAYIFGIFWIIEYGDALQNFVISYAVILWYYSENDAVKFCNDSCGGVKKPPFLPICRGFIKGVFYHSGSLAAGGFIIAVTRFISFIMKCISRQQEASGNRVLACIVAACVCCLECFRKVLEFINKNAYIDIAINSTWFCTAARHSFEFIMSNPTTIGVLNGACAIFQVIGVALPTFICSYVTYFMVTHVDRWANMESQYYIEDYVPICVAAGVICAGVSVMFMLVFDQAADTLLYVYIDNVKNDKDTVGMYAPKTLKDLVDGLPQDDKPPETQS